jgi:chorismate mutase/prephenate dehydratase
MTDASKNAGERIAELRGEIDDIDRRIVGLLNERAKRSLAIRDLKPAMQWSLYDPKREEQIFENLAKGNEGPLYSESLREIFAAILHVMKEL